MEKIKKLKKFFKKEKIDAYLIGKNDEYFGEYVTKQNDRLNFISNFTGSFGFALILKRKNYLFVDGRYTLQAQKQSGKSFKVITIPKRMPNDILKSKKIKIGFDPKLFTRKTINIFFGKTNCILKPLKKNLIDEIWRREINQKKGKFYALPRNSVNENFKSKIRRIVNYLKKKGADCQFITSSENNAWLLNIRGADSEFSPLPYSYILVERGKKIKLFCDLNKLPDFLKKKLRIIEFVSINSVTKIFSKISKKKFIIDSNTCSFFFEDIIKKNNRLMKLNDPIYNLKAIKSKKEIQNIKTAHIYDGIALTKYLFWVKENFLKKKITELSGSQKLYEFRKKNKNFKFLSFPTISGTGSNAAIIHYKPIRETNKTLMKGQVYLVDSGGQYEFGTTDVTRTISLGNSNRRVKNIFTRILKGHIAVANFKIKKNTSGSNIDKVARKYLNQIGLDYSHGTGHGVGYFLNVHEGPHAISKNNFIKLKEGMVVSNEPGYYEKNNFGIRIENLIYVKKKKNKKYFENLTLVPIDKDLIDIEMLSKHERIWLNKYHKKVFNNLKYEMNNKEFKELKIACSAI